MNSIPARLRGNILALEDEDLAHKVNLAQVCIDMDEAADEIDRLVDLVECKDCMAYAQKVLAAQKAESDLQVAQLRAEIHLLEVKIIGLEAAASSGEEDRW